MYADTRANIAVCMICFIHSHFARVAFTYAFLGSSSPPLFGGHTYVAVPPGRGAGPAPPRPRRADRAHRSGGAQGGQVELALLRARGPGLVPGPACDDQVPQGRLLPRVVVDSAPPVESKSKDTRYFHIHEGERLDEAQVSAWIRQAAALPGWLS